jgi:ubiquinone/menaquinone biosynthesis C-methylase UbiE
MTDTKPNKVINRSDQGATKIFDQRTLAIDYRTLLPFLKRGMMILDVGCGTGSISKDVARVVGKNGKVVGIDNTESFIQSGRKSYSSVGNLELIHADLFAYESVQRFDLVISARTLQWLSNPSEAILKMKSMLKPNGTISILDYNHDAIEWNSSPPLSMKKFYGTFLQWRKDAGMNNQIAADLPRLMEEAGLHEIQVFNADEFYHKEQNDFKSRAGIWSKVANSKQMVEEGYIDNALRLQAIDEYNTWIEHDAISMTLKLSEVRGKA